VAAAQDADADAALAARDRVLDRAVADLDRRRLPVAQEHLTAIDAQALDRCDRAIDDRLVRHFLAHLISSSCRLFASRPR